ncbi:MAG TPA: hypothetical protein VGO43_13630 [Pyrinomonadaceae bacterium]|jgi:hypothetical protein|nr:hypothetical protein [Pyrinomonadaceae bacterium]
MAIQTITGTVKDTGGTLWEATSVELQFAGVTTPGVTGKTDGDGAFSIEVFNNATEIKTVNARLEDGSTFAFELDPEDETMAIGLLKANGPTDTPCLRPVPHDVAWGEITGDLEDQTDLQAALDAKADV